MKCPRCWADKAYLHRYRSAVESLLGYLAFRPMKCHHCYHQFMVHWLCTLGKRIEPPVLQPAPDCARRECKKPVRRQSA